MLTGYGSSITSGRAVTGGPSSSPRPAVASAPVGASGASATTGFTISGSATGLYPGATKSLVLTVKNPSSAAIVVRSITVKVANASVRCPATELKVTSFSGHLLVRAHKTATTTLKVAMAHGAPNACQGARFPVHLCRRGEPDVRVLRAFWLGKWTWAMGAVIATVALLGPTTIAAAAWSTGGTGAGTGRAFTMPAGTTPTAVVSGTSVTVSWTASTFPDGTPVEGYRVTRSNGATGAPATIGRSCSIEITTTSCTESGVPAGLWVYAVVPVEASWVGAASPPSAAVSVP